MSGASFFVDMGQMPEMSEQSVVRNVASAYANQSIYSTIGDILIAMNPFESLPGLYNADAMREYRELDGPAHQFRPHVFNVARTAMAQLLSSSRSQIVLVSGESGSGKTETAKYLLRWITSLSEAPTILFGDAIGNAPLEERILAASPILEAFGNARTARNRNSSRFGKLTKIFFDRVTGRLRGAAIESYLLEKPRVTHLADTDTNFHVFYYLLAGAPADLRSRLALTQYTHVDFRYLLPGATTMLAPNVRADFGDDAARYAELVEALRVCGVSDAERADIYDILAAILHLGNCDFAFVKELKRLAPVQRSVLGTVARLLQIDASTLEKALTTRIVGSQARASTYSVPLDAAGVVDARESVARMLYSSLFRWLVERINRMLSGNRTNDDKFVAILDIFGFENFSYNSYEQLLINYANEKLHDAFLESVFRDEQRTYESEGIAWQSVTFEDNAACLTLLEHRPAGMLAMLDEECMLPTGSDDGFLRKAEAAFAQNKCFAMPRGGGAAGNRAAPRAEPGFVVRHFADDVTYAVGGIVEKNRDRLHADLVIALKSSKSPFICALLSDDMDDGGSGAAASSLSRRAPQAAAAAAAAAVSTTARKRPTQAALFRSQLDELCRMIRSVDRHFIRCIKPNAASVPRQIDEPMLRAQLHYTGVVAAARVRAAGFSLRVPFVDFVARFGTTTAADISACDARTACGIIAQGVVSAQRSDLCQLGRTRIFLKQAVVDLLEEARTRLRRQLALELQAAVRAVLARRQYETLMLEHRERVREERRRRAAEEEERRRRAAEEEERRRRAAEDEERRRRAAEDDERRRRAAADEEQQRRRRADEEAAAARARDNDVPALMSQRSQGSADNDIYVGLPGKPDDNRSPRLASPRMASPRKIDDYEPVPAAVAFLGEAGAAAAAAAAAGGGGGGGGNYYAMPRDVVRNAGGLIKSPRVNKLEYVELRAENFVPELNYAIMPPEDEVAAEPVPLATSPARYPVPQPPPASSASEPRYVALGPEALGGDLSYVAMPPEDYVSAPGRPGNGASIYVFDTEQGASHHVLPVQAGGCVTSDLLAELGRLFGVDDHRRFGLYMTQLGSTPPVKVRLDDDMDVHMCWSAMCALSQAGVISVRVMFLENARFSGTAPLWTKSSTPPALAAVAPAAAAMMPAGGPGGSIGRPRLKRTPVYKNLGEDETVGTLRSTASSRMAAAVAIGAAAAAVAPPPLDAAPRSLSPRALALPALPAGAVAATPASPPTSFRGERSVAAAAAVPPQANSPVTPQRPLSPPVARGRDATYVAAPSRRDVPLGSDAPQRSLSPTRSPAGAAAAPAMPQPQRSLSPRAAANFASSRGREHVQVDPQQAPQRSLSPARVGANFASARGRDATSQNDMMMSGAGPQRSLSPAGRANLPRREHVADAGNQRGVTFTGQPENLYDFAVPPASAMSSLRPGPPQNELGASLPPARVTPVSPRRDRGMSDPEAMQMRPVAGANTRVAVPEHQTFVRSGRSLYTAGAAGGAPAVVAVPVPALPERSLSPPRGGMLANRQVASAASALGAADAAAAADSALSPRRGESLPGSMRGADASLRPVESLAALQSRYGLNAEPVDAMLSALVERKFVRCTARSSSVTLKFGSLRGTMLMLFDDLLLFGETSTDVRALVLSECVVTPSTNGDLSVRIGNGSPDGDVRIQFESEGERLVWTQTLTLACNSAREREPPDPSTIGSRTGNKKGRTFKSMLSKGSNAAGDMLSSVTPDWRAVLEQCRESIAQSSRPWHLVVVARLHALCLAYAPA